MELKISKEIIKRLREAEFYPDTMMSSYLALMGLHLNKGDLLDIWDDFNKSRRAVVIYFDLLDKGYWKEASNPPLNFQETEKGALFCEELIALTFPKVNKADEVESWFEDWMDLFPKGVKTGGKLLRSDAKACLAKMKKFVKEYKFDRETIMAATMKYLNEREREGWQYTKSATYLISKQGEGSELGAQCANLQESLKDETKTNILYTTNSGLI